MRLDKVKTILNTDQAIADACGVTRQYVGQWKDVVPQIYEKRVLRAIRAKQKLIEEAIRYIDKLMEEK